MLPLVRPIRGLVEPCRYIEVIEDAPVLRPPVIDGVNLEELADTLYGAIVESIMIPSHLLSGRDNRLFLEPWSGYHAAPPAPSPLEVVAPLFDPLASSLAWCGGRNE